MLIADKIWVPDSYADKELVSLNRAVRNYDERLMFGRNETNGDWCVFVRMPHGNPPVAVLGFQNQLPTVETLLERVRRADTKATADDRLEAMNRHNARLRADAAAKADDGIGAAAEGWESFLHRRGDTPYHRSLRKRDPKQRSTA